MCSHMDAEWKLSVCLFNKGLGEGCNHGEHEEGHTNFYWEYSFWSTFQKEKEFPFSFKELQSPESQLVKLIKSPLCTLKLLQLSVVLNTDRLSRYRHATIQGFCFIMLLTRLLGLCKTTGLVYTRWYLWNSGSPLYPVKCAITYICGGLTTLSHMGYSQSLHLKMEHLRGWGLSHLHATSVVCHHRRSITSAASLKPGRTYKRRANVSSQGRTCLLKEIVA